MKVLTLKQPYASLVAEGAKLIEIRSWYTNYRGPFYIHVGSGTYPKKYIEIYKGIIDVDNLPKGQIIAKCDLVDCVHLDEKYIDKYNKENEDRGYTISYESIGDYGFILKNIRKLKNPIEAKGKLGFWEYKEE